MLSVALRPQAAEAQERTRFLRWSYQDAWALAVEGGARAPLILGSTGLLASASQLDPMMLDGVQAQKAGPLVDPFLDATNGLGDSSVPLLAAGVFGASLAIENPRFQDAAFTSLQSLVYARLLTSTLKGVVGRSRPDAEQGVHRFTPFSGRTSFPSGHATTAFALVTPWVLYYPHPATYSLFALSTGTAVARMAKDRHWPTDVIAGAAVGFFVARFLTRLHQGERSRLQDLSVAPAVRPDAVGVSLRLSID